MPPDFSALNPTANLQDSATNALNPFDNGNNSVNSMPSYHPNLPVQNINPNDTQQESTIPQMPSTFAGITPTEVQNGTNQAPNVVDMMNNHLNLPVKNSQQGGGIVNDITNMANAGSNYLEKNPITGNILGMGSQVAGTIGNLAGYGAGIIGQGINGLDSLFGGNGNTAIGNTFQKAGNIDTAVGQYGLKQGTSLEQGTNTGIGGDIAGFIGNNAVPTILAGGGSMAMQGAKMGLFGGIGQEGNNQTIGGDILNTGLGALGGKVLGGVSNYLVNKLPPSIVLNGLFGVQGLKSVQGALSNAGIDIPQDLGKWILDRVPAGAPQDMAKALTEYGQKSYQAVRSIMSAIPGNFTSDAADNALNSLKNTLAGKNGLEGDFNTIQGLLNKGGQYSASDLQTTKDLLDNYYNMFKASGQAQDNVTAQGMQNLRGGLKTQLEGIGKDYGVDISGLNQETSLAKGLSDAISKNDRTNSFLQALGAGSGLGGQAGSVLGGVAGGGYEAYKGGSPSQIAEAAGIGAGIGKIPALAGYLMPGVSSYLKMGMANVLNKLSPANYNALTDFIKSGGTSKIVNKAVSDAIDALNEKIANVKLLQAPGEGGMNDALNQQGYNPLLQTTPTPAATQSYEPGLTGEGGTLYQRNQAVQQMMRQGQSRFPMLQAPGEGSMNVNQNGQVINYPMGNSNSSTVPAMYNTSNPIIGTQTQTQTNPIANIIEYLRKELSPEDFKTLKDGNFSTPEFSKHFYK